MIIPVSLANTWREIYGAIDLFTMINEIECAVKAIDESRSEEYFTRDEILYELDNHIHNKNFSWWYRKVCPSRYAGWPWNRSYQVFQRIKRFLGRWIPGEGHKCCIQRRERLLWAWLGAAAGFIQATLFECSQKHHWGSSNFVLSFYLRWYPRVVYPLKHVSSHV